MISGLKIIYMAPVTSGAFIIKQSNISQIRSRGLEETGKYLKNYWLEYSTFHKNYKPTDQRRLINLDGDKHKENHSK